MTTPAHHTRHRSATVEPLMYSKRIPLGMTGEGLERAWDGAQHEGRIVLGQTDTAERR
ncbi:hypothetical protein HMPREF9701_05173 [Delftia acidovorans CCUG 274B]|uniref:hypothetical protein n=1 Tax=Delftia acidovorans TaxID=80866 RepID=UPI0003545DD5|nr:hypothetical protein [Delftia acidovorans]EPD35597.1 hypothetical protein HMPREF9701_05173 [Delftia acidovorans CCUG 274B]